MEAIYRHHPIFAKEDFKIWYGGVETDWGPATVEGGDVHAARQGRRDDRDGGADEPPGRQPDRPRDVQGGPRCRAGARGDAAALALLHAPRHGVHHGRPRRGDPVPRRRRRSSGLGNQARRRSRDPGLRGVRRRRRRGDRAGAGDRLDPGHPDRWRSLRDNSASNGTTATTSSASSPAWSSPTSATSTPTRSSQGGHRGDHDRGLRARSRPRRLSLHDLPDRTRPRLLSPGEGSELLRPR